MRLIDADKLDWWYKGRPIRKVIDEAPTVDAVPVVRCKDCKHYKPQKKSTQWHGTTPYCCRCTTVKVSPDDFCSYGEKKANADQDGEIDFDYSAED